MEEYNDIRFDLAMTLTTGIWNAILFILLSYKLYKHRKEDTFGSKVIVAATLTNFCGWCICYLIKGIIKIGDIESMNLELSVVFKTSLWCIYSLVYSIAFVSSYIFVILMLYHSFKGSEFEISKCTLYSHTIFVIILFFSCGAATVFLNLYPYYLGGYLSFLNVFIYCIGLCRMVYTLNMKLIKMILLANDKSKLNLFNKMSQKFMKTITKLSVLQGMFTFSAILYVITAVLHNVILYNYYSYLLDWIIYVITVMTGTLCMYLTFTVNTKEYNILCKCCDKCCTRGCNLTVMRLYGSEIMISQVNDIRRGTMSIKSHSRTTRTTRNELTQTRETREQSAYSTTIRPDGDGEDTINRVDNDKSSAAYRQSMMSITALSTPKMIPAGSVSAPVMDPKLGTLTRMGTVDESAPEMEIDLEIGMGNLDLTNLGSMELPKSINLYDITPQPSLENNLQ